jgi:hypothetical protein
MLFESNSKINKVFFVCLEHSVASFRLFLATFEKKAPNKIQEMHFVRTYKEINVELYSNCIVI